MRNVIVIKGDSPELTNVLAAVSKTSATGVSNLIAANGTLVASNLNDLDNIRVVFISTHRKLYALSEDRALLIYTATHCRLVTGYELPRNIHNILKKLIFPRKSRYFA
jgi:hypothetical protein